MANIFERLLYLIEMFTNNSQTKFAKSIDWPQTTFNGYLNEQGQAKIRLTLFQDIMKRYPQINRDWLYFGEGEPLVKDSTGQGERNFAALTKEKDLLSEELAKEISLNRKLTMQNADLYEECKALKEKLSFLEEADKTAPLHPNALSSQAGQNLSSCNEEPQKQ